MRSIYNIRDLKKLQMKLEGDSGIGGAGAGERRKMWWLPFTRGLRLGLPSAQDEVLFTKKKPIFREKSIEGLDLNIRWARVIPIRRLEGIPS